MKKKIQIINNILEEKAKLHLEDIRHDDYLDKLFDLLVDDENDSVSLINALDSFSALLEISPLFGPLSGRFQSKRFVDAIPATSD